MAARSYALATSGDGAFDVYDDTRSQVYGGKGSETDAHQQGRQAHPRPRGAPRQAGGDDLLLLDLGRPDGERRVRLPRRRPGPLPEERPRPLRRGVPRPQVEGPLLAERDRVAALGAVSPAGCARSTS